MAGKALQTAILKAISTLDPAKLYKDRAGFVPVLDSAFEKAGLKIPAPVRKAILAALSERDETAAICRDANGVSSPIPTCVTPKTSRCHPTASCLCRSPTATSRTRAKS